MVLLSSPTIRYGVKDKSDHILRSSDGTEYKLYVTTEYELGGSSVIIVNESASGDGAVVYHNGRTQENVPINGILMGNSREDVNNKKNELQRLRDLGEIVEFEGPYRFLNRSNKYYIQDIKFSITAGDDKSLPFTMTLTEYRTANVNIIAINAVNFQLSQDLINLYNERIGNI